MSKISPQSSQSSINLIVAQQENNNARTEYKRKKKTTKLCFDYLDKPNQKAKALIVEDSDEEASMT